MIEFLTANKVLEQVIFKDVSFKKALKSVFKDGKQKSDLLSNVSALAGCELRHHYLYLDIYKQLGFELSEIQQIDLYLFLSNKYFLRRFDLEESVKYLKNSLGEQLFSVIYPYFENLESVGSMVEYPHDSIEFLSIRFNCPKWLIKMWSKHYGRGNCFKILKKNVKPFFHTFRVNTLPEKAVDSRELALEFDNFGVKDMVVYAGKGNPRNSGFVKDDNVFPLRAPIKEIVDKYQNDFIDEIACYSGDDNSIVKELLVRSNLKVGINLAVPDLEQRAEVMRQIRLNKAKNINLFKATDPISMRTGISKKQELFFVFPQSSSFDKIRSYPDYLLQKFV